MDYVLITGASSGIGKAFAEEYASRGHKLILVARSEEKLGSIADRLENAYSIDVRTFQQDLSLSDSAEKVFDFCNHEKLDVGILVNNAGFGLDGAFDTVPLEKLEKMVVLHNITLMKLTRLFLPQMKSRNRGAVINLSSIVAFQGVPYNAVYAATKAFVLSFSESIREELRHSGVRIFALCPGLTETDIFDNTGIDPHLTFMPVGTVEPVVKAALNALEKGKPYTVPGFINKILIHGGRLLPRTLMLKIGMLLSRRGKSAIKRPG